MKQARQLYNKGLYNSCLERLYNIDKGTKIRVWCLIIFSLLLDALSLYLDYYAITMINNNPAVAAGAVVAVGAVGAVVAVVAAVAVGAVVAAVVVVAAGAAGAVVAVVAAGAVGAAVAAVVVVAAGAVGAVVVDKLIKYLCKKGLKL